MAIETQLVKKLVQIPIFGALTLGEAADFFDAAAEAEVEQGKTLFREGDGSDSLQVILEGEVLVTRKGVELARLGRHAVLGEMSIVDGAPRSATATALSDVKLLKVPSLRVQAQLKANNVAALKVVAHLAGVMSKRLSLINDKLAEALGQDKKREELADFSRTLHRWDF
ncbi:MAG: cyclic nucleotide-binding domain-containing protein [Myxococcota bacterium]|jgi:CRP-like cAMP-binding protein